MQVYQIAERMVTPQTDITRLVDRLETVGPRRARAVRRGSSRGLGHAHRGRQGDRQEARPSGRANCTTVSFSISAQRDLKHAQRTVVPRAAPRLANRNHDFFRRISVATDNIDARSARSESRSEPSHDHRPQKSTNAATPTTAGSIPTTRFPSPATAIPHHMQFRSLRVMNEDWIAPGQGFGRHPHQDMEIVTYVLEGELEHQDSMGNGSVLHAGDFQRMTAGTGVEHSEFNPSADETVHLYQIWLYPSERGLAPSYEERSFRSEREARPAAAGRFARWPRRIRSPSIRMPTSISAIWQPARASRTAPPRPPRLGASDARHRASQRRQWHAAATKLTAGDAAAVSEESNGLQLTAASPVRSDAVRSSTDRHRKFQIQSPQEGTKSSQKPDVNHSRFVLIGD